MTASSGERRAWGWVTSLLAGGTEPWHDWGEEGHQGGRALPGAQQLELLRRLNLTGQPGPVLAQRVLEASAPGRGTADLELVGAAAESRFGPRPVDPAGLPDRELVRVATSLIAEEVVAAGTPGPARAPRTRPWRRPYRLTGDSWQADWLRDQLRRHGHPPGGRRPTVLVVGSDLATMLTHAWTARAFDQGGSSWPDWLAGVVAHDRIPPRADLVAMARAWSERVGRERVRVVLDPAAVPRLAGTRRRLTTPPRLSADATDLARLVSAPLGLLVLPARRAELLQHTLRPRLVSVPGLPLGVPARHHDWVRDRAERMRDALLEAGYAVEGDPDALLPPDAAAPGADPADAGVLALALRVLLDREEER